VKAATDLALFRAVAERSESLPPRINGELATRNPIMMYARRTKYRRAGAGSVVRLPKQSTSAQQVGTPAKMGSTGSSLEPWRR
jgi:hypothetical protein